MPPVLVDAILTPAEIAQLPASDLSDATCVVFDVLRATSSMVTGLAHGVRSIYPVSTIEEAWALREHLPEALLGGERHGERIEGFDIGNSPLEYRDLTGRDVISTTTNGTVAIRAAGTSRRILIGAVLNLAALAEELRRHSPERVVLICAGTYTSFALEDAWGAGRLVELLGPTNLTDAAAAVHAVAQRYPEPLTAMHSARNGKALAAKGRGAEVEWCGQESRFNVVAEMIEGRIQRL